MRNSSMAGFARAILVGGIVVCAPALADKPEGVGKGHGQKPTKESRQAGGAGQDGHGRHSDGRPAYFEEKHRVVVREYFSESERAGRCPPGLAKKHNGCLPPGQAKKWKVGRPLPRDAVYYDLPPQVVVRLGVPPAGQKFVRIAGDILLIAVGTGMVIDAIEDLARQ